MRLHPQALIDVKAAAAGRGRTAVAATWAKSLADTDLLEPLRALLECSMIRRTRDISTFCRTQRAYNLLHKNDLHRLDRVLELSVHDLWAIRGCGAESVIDILTATLLALTDEAASGDTGEQLALEDLEAFPTTRNPAELLVERTGSLDERQIDQVLSFIDGLRGQATESERDVTSVATDLLVDDRPAACWLDAFPWLEAVQTDTKVDEDGPWWLKPVDAPGTSQRADRLALVSDLALERLTRWTVGQIFPGLPAETSLLEIKVGNRAHNAMARFNYRVAGDILQKELADLLGMPQVGIGTVDSILQGLADASTSAAAPILQPERRQGRRHTGRWDPDGRLGSWSEAVIEDLRLIASWYAALGAPARPLLGSELAPGTPAEVIKARERLESITPADVLDQAQVGFDAADLLQSCVGVLDGRAQQILVRRFFADEPETLDELGRSLDITRERVRQVEAKARANMVEFLEPGGSLELIASAARNVVDEVLPLDDLLALLPALARTVEAVQQPAWRVLDRLDDHYEIHDGWCASPTLSGAQAATLTRLQELADHYGVVRIEDVGSLNPHLSDEAGRRSLRDWLLYCGYVLDGDYVFTRIQSVRDRAASVLSIVGSPMSAQDILDRLAVERSLSSLKNAMGADDRFERVDRDRWALAEWGLESYGGVRALVRGEVARAGGKIDMETLVEHITRTYNVTASSVVAYASSPPFEAKGGVVRVAPAGRDVRKSPERTRRLYRRTTEWLYRVRVTKEHLRGSGSVAPVAVASVLGLKWGETQLLASGLGPQKVGWVGTQPTFGTIRRFLIANDIEIGSDIFLVIGDDGSFHVESVAIDIAEPLDHALVLAGANDVTAREHPRVALARAIGLPDESPAASVIGGYRERGDDDIAELLMSVKDSLEDAPEPRTVPAADIQDILDLL